MRLTPGVWLLVFVLVSLPAQAAVGMRASRTASVTGDEPFYLATTQSLVSDGDLDLRDEYADGGAELRRFWDGRIPLWKQMDPAPDGRLLAPHEPGLSLLIAPAYAVGGLAGAQRFLALLWAAAMATAAVLALGVLGALPSSLRAERAQKPAVLAAVAVGAGAPGIVYASQVYPEGPAALCVAVALVLIASTRARPLMFSFVAVVLAWLGVKYIPLGLLLAGGWAWRHRDAPRALVAAGALAGLAAVHYVWWHLDTFGGLTPYTTNVVWSGESDASILADHLDVTERLYRLYGLFLDARFGLLRWLPVAVLALIGVGRATVRYAAVVVVCVLMGTFASITMMGWWFPGRMLVAGLPAVVVLVRHGIERLPRVGAVLAAWSVAIGAAVAWGAHHGWVRLAVDPFDLGPPLAPRWLFPDFREFAAPEVVVTTVWFVALAGLLWVTRWRRSCSSTGTRSHTERSSRSRPTWRPQAGK